MSRIFVDMYRARWAYLFIAPLALLFFALTAYPILLGVSLSFYDYSVSSASWVGLANYYDLLGDSIFMKALWNTLLLVLGLVPSSLGIGLILALLVEPLPRPLQSFFRAAFYLPIVIGAVVLSLVWAWIFNPMYGLLNQLLDLFGASPVNWLGDPGVALFSIFLVVLCFSVGVPLILYGAALGAIPEEYYEAARVDGAGAGTRFWHITLPLLKPTTLFLFVNNTIGAFQVWVVIYLLTGGGPVFSTQTLAFRLFDVGFLQYKFGVASAIGTILFFLTMIVAVGQFRWLRSNFEQ